MHPTLQELCLETVMTRNLSQSVEVSKLSPDLKSTLKALTSRSNWQGRNVTAKSYRDQNAHVIGLHTFDDKLAVMFKNKALIVRNLKDNTTHQIILPHQDDVIFSAQIESGKILSGSLDKTIKLSDLNKEECSLVLSNLTAAPREFMVSDGVIIAGLDDGTIDLWDPRMSAPYGSYELSKDSIGPMTFVNNKLYVVFDYRNICELDLRSENVELVLLGHTEKINALVTNGRNLFSGSDDNTLKVWDIKQGTCLKTLDIKCCGMRTMQFDSSTESLLTGGADGKLQMWDLYRGQKLAEWSKSPFSVTAIERTKESIFTGHLYGDIVCLGE